MRYRHGEITILDRQGQPENVATLW